LHRGITRAIPFRGGVASAPGRDLGDAGKKATTRKDTKVHEGTHD
jgi:hypothetical protein